MAGARGIALAAGLLLALGSGARAQDDGEIETALERVLRDQGRIGLRLEGLSEKMERLAARYEDEGRTRNATLLRDALAEFEQRNLLDLSRELERNLESGNLSSVEQQDSLAAALEDIYALLRDRRDVEDLSTQADLAREGVAELGFLAQNERRLLSETRAATDQPGELLEQALTEAEQLAKQLQTAGAAAETASKAELALGDAALAESLAKQQRALAEDNLPRSQTQALLEEALAMLRERLEQPVDGAADQGVAAEAMAAAEASRGEARKAAERAAVEMAAARKALQAAEGDPSGRPAEPGAETESETGEPGGEQTGGEQGGEPTGGEQTGGEQGGEQTGGEQTGGEQGGEQTGGEQTGGEQTGGEPSDGEPSEGEEPGESGEPSERSADPLEGARERMREAAEELEDVRDALERSERSLAAARNRAKAMATASSREAAGGGEQMEELAQRLEAVQPDEGPELLDRTRELLAELERMAESAEKGDMAGTQAGQQSAETSLNDMLEMLKQRNAQAGDDEPRPPPDAQALADLADRQAELQRRMRELMDRLAELPDQGFQQPLSRAGEAMTGAEGALRRGDSREATLREREAAEELEQAQSKLAGERDKYEQLRQEEVLFRLGEELTALLEAHEAARIETIELDEARAETDRLGRSQRRAVSRLAGQERDLSVQAEALRSTLAENGAIAFTFSLSRTRDDLQTVTEELTRESTGGLVQSVQEDVSQRLRDLLAVLENERERRRDAETQEPQPGEPQQQGPPQLVPTVAELLLIQRMEQAALARLESFIRLNPEIRDEDYYSDLERELLDRWAGEHDDVSDMFRSMVSETGGNPMPDGDASMEEGAEPPDELPEGGGGDR